MANLSAKDYQSLCNNIKLDDDQCKKKKRYINCIFGSYDVTLTLLCDLKSVRYNHGGHAFAPLEIVEEDKLDFRNEKCFHFYLTTF